VRYRLSPRFLKFANMRRVFEPEGLGEDGSAP